jgi:hypothetical protein
MDGTAESNKKFLFQNLEERDHLETYVDIGEFVKMGL